MNCNLADVSFSDGFSPGIPNAVSVFNDGTNVYFWSPNTDDVPNMAVHLRFFQVKRTVLSEIFLVSAGPPLITKSITNTDQVLTSFAEVCTPTLSTVPGLGSVLLWYSMAAPDGYSQSGTPGQPGFTTTNITTHYYCGGLSYGLMGFTLVSGTYKYRMGRYPGFTGTTEWFNQLDFHSHIGGVDSTYTQTGSFTVSGESGPAGMSTEYGNYSGFALQTQTDSSRTWVNGDDYITITLSDPYTLSDYFSSPPELFEFDTGFIEGSSTAGPFAAFQLRHTVQDSTHSPTTISDVVDYVEAHGTYILLNEDGTWTIENATIPPGSDNFPPPSGHGTLTLDKPGQIIWFVKGWDTVVTGSPATGTLFSDFA